MTNVYKERMNVNCIRKILYRCTYFSILYLCQTYGKKFWFKSRTIIIRLKYLKEGFFLLNFANLLMSSCSCQKIIPFKNILIDKKSVTKTKTRTSFQASKGQYIFQSLIMYNNQVITGLARLSFLPTQFKAYPLMYTLIDHTSMSILQLLSFFLSF